MHHQILSKKSPHTLPPANSILIIVLAQKLGFFLLVFLFLYCSAEAQQKVDKEGRTTFLFEDDWSFHKGKAEGAENPKFRDNDWSVVQLPHDWTISEETDRDNATGRGGGFFPANVGWYRKTFSLPKEASGKKVFLEFDGIMANSDVWINGEHLGHRPFGYVSFRYDLTPHLKKNNVIAVRADNLKQPASRWYTGAGIYRHVRMIITDPVHVEQWSVFISTPEVSKEKATVRAQSRVVNETGKQQKVTVQTTIRDPHGKDIQTVAENRTIQAGEAQDYQKDIEVINPLLWGLKNPHLYSVLTQVRSAENELLDEKTTSFGIRSFRFEAKTGFYLNNENMKIKGVCLHHDGGAMGAAVPLSVWKKRLELLRGIGVNAVRVSHNPFAPEFYELCDRMGFLVMEETFDTWYAKKNHADYGYQHFFGDWWEADTRDVVMRNRNHPSIIIYSIGNEIRDNLNSKEGFKVFTDQRDLIHKLDPTRPVTMALFRPNVAGVYDNGFAELMDVVGQNYRENELVQAHLDKPSRKIIGTETGHSRKAWLAMRDNDFFSGQFIWTGFDYLGEADWPELSADFGIFDRTGGTKPRTFERKSWWSNEPMVHVARKERNAGGGDLVSDWTPADNNTYDMAHLEVYSNTEEVELFLNGISLGLKKVPEDASPINWEITFRKGTIKAVGKNGDKEVAVHEMKTAGEPARIVLTADKTQLSNDWDDVSHITAKIVDKDGVLCPNAEPKLSFELVGPGEIAAVDNANRQSHEPFQARERRAHRGEAIAILKATASKGKLQLKASAPGLEDGEVTIETVEPVAGKK